MFLSCLKKEEFFFLKKVHPEESSKIMKMVEHMTAPELGERTEQRYEWPLWVTHLAAISASFPLLNGSSENCPGTPPLREPRLAVAPAQSPPWAPVPTWFTVLGCLWPHPLHVVLAVPSKLPRTGKRQGAGGTHLHPPIHPAGTLCSRAGSSPDGKSMYVLVCTTKSSMNDEIFIVGLRYCWWKPSKRKLLPHFSPSTRWSPLSFVAPFLCFILSHVLVIFSSIYFWLSYPSFSSFFVHSLLSVSLVFTKVLEVKRSLNWIQF